jgi:adenylate cyclase
MLAAVVTSAFLGVIAAVAIYHLFLFAVLRANAYLAYGTYLIALIAFEFVGSSLPVALGLELDLNWLFWWSFAALAPLGYWLFRAFLDLPAMQPRLDLAFRAFAAVVCAAALLAPWMPHAYTRLVEALALLLLALAATSVFVAMRRGVRVATFFGLAYAGLFAGALARAAHDVAGAKLGPFAPLAAAGIETGTVFQALTLALGLADRIAVANEERDHAQRRTIEEISSLNVAYSRFVPRTFLDLLGADDVRDVRLGDGIERTMAVLFSDVRSFTTISEALAPREIFGFINALLSRTGPVVRECGGIVDKYVGDAIMALFPGGPPDAVRAGIGLQTAVDAFNVERLRNGEAPIAVGVGVHAGALMLGTIGEAERMDGTVIADAVNVASRIEGLTKFYGARMLVSDAVVAALDDDLARRFLGNIVVKGTSQPIGLYEIIAADLPARREAKARTAPRFDAAVATFVAGAFADAARAFEDVLAADPQDGAARRLLERALDLATRRVAWTGADVAVEK